MTLFRVRAPLGASKIQNLYLNLIAVVLFSTPGLTQVKSYFHAFQCEFQLGIWHLQFLLLFCGIFTIDLD